MIYLLRNNSHNDHEKRLSNVISSFKNLVIAAKTVNSESLQKNSTNNHSYVQSNVNLSPNKISEIRSKSYSTSDRCLEENRTEKIAIEEIVFCKKK